MSVEYGFQVASNRIEGKSWSESLTEIDKGDVAIAGAMGAATSGASAFVGSSMRSAGRGTAARLMAQGTVEGTGNATEGAIKANAGTSREEISGLEVAADFVVGGMAGRAGDFVQARVSDMIPARSPTRSETRAISNAERRAASRSAEGRSVSAANHTARANDIRSQLFQRPRAFGAAAGRTSSSSIIFIEYLYTNEDEE
jgi:hypothetical protein